MHPPVSYLPLPQINGGDLNCKIKTKIDSHKQ